MKYRKKSIEVEAVQWDGRNGTFLKIKKMDDSNGIYLSGDFNNVITICDDIPTIRRMLLFQATAVCLFPVPPPVFPA